MKRIIWLAALLACSFAASPAAAAAPASAETASDRMFDRLKGLAGDWEGTYQWTDGRSGQLKANYYLTGNGSALVENLIMGDAASVSMTSIYHLDGPDLRMTHFCAARNQPRFKASKIDESAGTVDFAFVDVTNANPAKPAYVVAASLQLVAQDQLNIKFTFGGNPATKGVESIALRRATGHAAQG